MKDTYSESSQRRDFFRKLDNVRDLLREMFIYGNISPLSYEQSTSKYNKDKLRIIIAINKDYIKDTTIDNKKCFGFRTDMFETNYNYLTDIYFNTCFKSDMAFRFLHIYLYLASKAKPVSLEEITIHFFTFAEENDAGENVFSITPQSIRRDLDTMVDLGYVEAIKEKNYKTYKLAKDILSDLNIKEFKSLITAVSFFSNVLYPSTIGSMLNQELQSLFSILFNSEFTPPELIFNGNHFAHVLDDDVSWNILTAINEKKPISFDYKSAKGIVKHKGIIPISIIADEAYGRRYLMAVNEDFNLTEYKLSSIFNSSIEKHSYTADISKQIESFNSGQRYSYSGISIARESRRQEIVLHIQNTALSQFKNAIHCEAITAVNDNISEVKLITNSYRELLPLLRQYIGQIEVYSNDKLQRLLDEDLQKWREKYGII